MIGITVSELQSITTMLKGTNDMNTLILTYIFLPIVLLIIGDNFLNI